MISATTMTAPCGFGAEEESCAEGECGDGFLGLFVHVAV